MASQRGNIYVIIENPPVLLDLNKLQKRKLYPGVIIIRVGILLKG
jgi:hypothetical protein